MSEENHTFEYISSQCSEDDIIRKTADKLIQSAYTQESNIYLNTKGFYSLDSIFAHYTCFRNQLIKIETSIKDKHPKKNISLSSLLDDFDISRYKNTYETSIQESIPKNIQIEFLRLRNEIYDIVSPGVQTFFNTIPQLAPTEKFLRYTMRGYESLTSNHNHSYLEFKKLSIFNDMNQKEVLPHLLELGIIKKYSIQFGNKKTKKDRIHPAFTLTRNNSYKNNISITVNWDILPEKIVTNITNTEKAKTDFFQKEYNVWKEKKSEKEE